MRKKITPFILAVGLYSVCLALVFGRALFPADGYLLFGDDIHRSYYFFTKYLASSIREGIVPWWNPYMFSGVPFLANPITNAFYPVNWLFFFLPAGQVYPVSIMIHLLIAMTGMYVLLSAKRKAQSAKLSAWVAGLVFGLSGFFSARIYAGHIDMISSASYLPIVLFMFLRAMEAPSPRTVVFAGGMFALQLLAGYHTMAFFTLIAVGALALLVSCKRRDIVALGVGVAGAGIGVGLTAFSILPIQEFVRLSIRTFPRTYEWSSYGAIQWRETLQLINPFVYGDQLTYWASPPNYWEHALFVGRMGIALALIGLVATLLKRSHRIMGLLSVFLVAFGVWVSVGPHAPFDLQKILWQMLPMYKYVRIPSRHLLLATVGLSMLVSTGMSRIRGPLVRYLIVVLLAAEMILYARHFIALAPIPEARHDVELINILKQDSELFRLLPNFGVWVAPRDSLDFDSVMEYKIFSTSGYDSTLLGNYYEFIDAVNGARMPSMLEHDVQVPYTDVYRSNWDILNIKYMIVPTFVDPLGGKSNDQFSLRTENLDRQYRLYEYKHPRPRFFFADWRVVGSREAAYELIRTQSVNLSEEVLIESKYAPQRIVCPYESSQKVIVESYTPNRIQLTVTSPCESIMTSSEVMYPGWTATIDGVKTDVFEGNLAFRTILVPAGTHAVQFQFRPRIFMIGGLTSVVTLIVCCIAVTVHELTKKHVIARSPDVHRDDEAIPLERCTSV